LRFPLSSLLGRGDKRVINPLEQKFEFSRTGLPEYFDSASYDNFFRHLKRPIVLIIQRKFGGICVCILFTTPLNFAFVI
jgi:hypothetical protein